MVNPFRVVDVFGTGSLVEHYDDRRNLMFSCQRFPTGLERWTAWDALPAEEGGNQVIGMLDAHATLSDAMRSIKGARISQALKDRHQAKYQGVPRAWPPEARKFAKALIDAGVGIERFAASTQSRSVYFYLESGEKIRLADHALPLAYEAADFDFRYGVDLNTAITQITSSCAPAGNFDAPMTKNADKNSACVQDIHDFQIKINDQWFHAERVFGKPAHEFRIGEAVYGLNTKNPTPKSNDVTVKVPSTLFRESGANLTDEEKIRAYAAAMEAYRGWGDFPPVYGRIEILTEDDVARYKELDSLGFAHELAYSRPLTEADIGKRYVHLENGHHRAYAAAFNGFEICAIDANLEESGPAIQSKREQSCGM